METRSYCPQFLAPFPLRALCLAVDVIEWASDIVSLAVNA